MRIQIITNNEGDYIFCIGTKRINESVFPRKLYYINDDEYTDFVLFRILRRLDIQWK